MISIIKSPSKYSPASNPLFLSVQSNDPDIVYFKINVFNPSGSTLISSSKYPHVPSLKPSVKRIIQ